MRPGAEAAISRELAGKINMMRVLLLATALAGLSSMAANAGEITVTGYDLPDGEAYGVGLINGYSYYDGPVTLHVQGGPDITAYCADLNHILQGGAGLQLRPAHSERARRPDLPSSVQPHWSHRATGFCSTGGQRRVPGERRAAGDLVAGVRCDADVL